MGLRIRLAANSRVNRGFTNFMSNNAIDENPYSEAFNCNFETA
jgi:hypothetical protein